MFSLNFKRPQRRRTERLYSSDDSLSETERQAIHIELEEMTPHPQRPAGAVGRVQPCRGAKRKAQESIDNVYLKEEVWRDAQEVLRISKRRKMTELIERGLLTSRRGKRKEIVASQLKSDIGHSDKMLIYGKTRRGEMNVGEGASGTDFVDCGEVLSRDSRLCDDGVQETEEGPRRKGNESYDLNEAQFDEVDGSSITSQSAPSRTNVQDESENCEERYGHEIGQDEISGSCQSDISDVESRSSNTLNLQGKENEEESSESHESDEPDTSQSEIRFDGRLLPFKNPTAKRQEQAKDRCIICFNDLETIHRNSLQSNRDPTLVIWTCDQCQTVQLGGENTA
ncbi:hypothetical protein I203_106621 [Kwoniella mangroviensis CBS 8507]|uniref:uncharacterized protein n=1 Tax=Kwoniella mangroviensis CBS 8507 TaxID=1296122 RepID=UPI00080D0B7C|nr:uncharacterized protein I203_06882 [Kwoniella mangroviensis CBS 8507]OCF63926.1 hypothetical protein I203_06882 [Kwoniella mangroviensis CBS 8507]